MTIRTHALHLIVAHCLSAGGCDLTPVGYAHMTARLLTLARGRMVVALEGGYNLTSISRYGSCCCCTFIHGAVNQDIHAHVLRDSTHTR